MDSNAISNALMRTAIFRNADGASINKLAEAAIQKTVERGQRFVNKGDHLDGFFVLLKGKVKLTQVSEQGSERVVEILHAGMTFGEASMFHGHYYPLYAEALENSTLLFIPRNGVIRILKSDHDIALKILGLLSQRIFSLMSEMEAFCLHSSKERVTGFLLQELNQKSGLQTPLMVELPATKAATASLLNLSPETFSRVIHGLERDGVISLSGRQVQILDLARLKGHPTCQ